MPSLHRLLLPLLPLLLAACGRGPAPADAPGGLTPIILQTDWYAQPEHGGFYQALARGFYREAGLEVTIQQGGPNAMTTQKVAQGNVQFSIGRSDEVIIAAARGVSLTMAGALMQKDPQAILAHEEGGIETFADLDGRTIMAVPGSAFLEILRRKYGIRFDVTPLDYGMSRFIADKRFVQQCFITNEPYYVALQGARPRTLLISDSGFSPYRVWYTSRRYAAANPGIVRAFTAASIRGWIDYLEGDPAPANELIAAANPKMDASFMAFGIDAMRRHRLVQGDPGEEPGLITRARLALQIEQLTAIGMLDRPPSVDEVFTPEFLPAELQARAAATAAP